MGQIGDLANFRLKYPGPPMFIYAGVDVPSPPWSVVPDFRPSLVQRLQKGVGYAARPEVPRPRPGRTPSPLPRSLMAPTRGHTVDVRREWSNAIKDVLLTRNGNKATGIPTRVKGLRVAVPVSGQNV